MKTTKEVHRTEPKLRGEHKGFRLYATYVNVYRMKEGVCVGGSDRTEWHGENGSTRLEARTLKALKQAIDRL